MSTVDSGNLAAYLWTLREACAELSRMPLFDAQTLEAARDALWLSRVATTQTMPPEHAELDGRLARAAAELEQESLAALRRFGELEAVLRDFSRGELAARVGSESRYWLEQAAAVLAHARAQAHELAPCLEWLEAAPAALAEHEGFRELRLRLARARTPAELGPRPRPASSSCPSSSKACPDAGAALKELGACLLATERACEAFGARAAKLAQQAVDLGRRHGLQVLVRRAARAVLDRLQREQRAARRLALRCKPIL